MMSLPLIFLLIGCCFAAEKSASYNVDPSETSVSGISSGGYFATQVQVAFSALIIGAGIVAGGSYNCGGQMSYTSSKHKVYMISGTSDSTVGVSVMTQLYKYYSTDGQFIPDSNVVFKKDLKSGHTFPADFDSAGNNGCGSGLLMGWDGFLIP
ncbi:unnamed protein product [Rotaria magnacalcarata]|uniref:Uncharacterized protein n=1 Tax=Rotaria magnacalcarata TaxID=392030 RepID=A0A820EZR1_9BILA|nr:unnamed protein product [Rotaria magnacalcarata]